MRTSLTAFLSGAALVAIFALPAHARQDTPPQGLDAVYKCAQETDEAKRLACFDAATRDLKTAEDSGELVTVTREDVEQEKRNSFGFATSTLSTIGNLFSGRSSDSDTESATEEAVVETASHPEREKSAPAPVLDLDQLSNPILKTEEFGYERTRFYLANGQVWDQLDRGYFRVPKERNGVSNIAEIRRGALGSYMLQVNGSGKTIAVRRRR